MDTVCRRSLFYFHRTADTAQLNWHDDVRGALAVARDPSLLGKYGSEWEKNILFP
jgi:hypothetical protein